MDNLASFKTKNIVKIKKIILFLLVMTHFSFTNHKFYLSLTQIEYREELKSIQIIINVFLDDIEYALNKDYNIDLQLFSKKELPSNDIYFKKYLSKKLKLTINNKAKEFNYIGKEYEDDLVYFYIEIKKIDELNSLEIENKILINHFPSQQNLIKLKFGKKNKSLLLNSKNYKGLLKI